MIWLQPLVGRFSSSFRLIGRSIKAYCAQVNKQLSEIFKITKATPSLSFSYAPPSSLLKCVGGVAQLGSTWRIQISNFATPQPKEPNGDLMRLKKQINQTIGKKMAVATIALASWAVGNVRAEMGDTVDQSNVKHNAVAIKNGTVNMYFEHGLIILELPGVSGQIACVFYVRIGQELTESEITAIDKSNIPAGTGDFKIPVGTTLPVGAHGWHSDSTGLFVLHYVNYPMNLDGVGPVTMNGRLYATAEGLELMGQYNKSGKGLMPKVN